jgi:hypothetical protein
MPVPVNGEAVGAVIVEEVVVLEVSEVVAETDLAAAAAVLVASAEDEEVDLEEDADG